MKENFYPGIVLGLFGYMDSWCVMSNAESGDGYSDIVVEIEDRDIGIIIELKYAEKAALMKPDKRQYNRLKIEDMRKF